MPCASYKRRAKSLVNQKVPCFVVVLLLKQNALHTAAPTQNASVCSGMRIDMRLPKALYTNNPPILTVGSSEAGNETMLGKAFKACNVKPRLHSTPTETT